VSERPALRYIPADAPPPAEGLRGYGEPELIPALLRQQAAPPAGVLSAWSASYGERAIGGRNRPTAANGVSSEHLTQILDTTSQPWRFLVNLTTFMPTGQALGGSGWLLGPRTVITAGHNVFSRMLNSWANRVEVRVARNGTSEPYPVQAVSGSELQSVEGWVNDGQEASDFGALILPQPVSAGSFGIDTGITDAQLNSVLIAVAGYPLLQSDTWGTLWAEAHFIAQATEDRLYYAVATVEGMSGGPVFLTDQNGARFVVGIHNYLSSDNQFGIATRVNPLVANYLAQWRALGDAQP
jgi:V8-like Glu-specific endopeptidase